MNKMEDWKELETYCGECRRWATGHHKNCRVDMMGSRVLIDLYSFRLRCDKCGQTWHLQNDVLYCRYGHVQKTPYRDSTVALEVGDQIIRSVGDLVYVLRRSGTVAVGRRDYIYSSYRA